MDASQEIIQKLKMCAIRGDMKEFSLLENELCEILVPNQTKSKITFLPTEVLQTIQEQYQVCYLASTKWYREKISEEKLKEKEEEIFKKISSKEEENEIQNFQSEIKYITAEQIPQEKMNEIVKTFLEKDSEISLEQVINAGSAILGFKKRGKILKIRFAETFNKLKKHKQVKK